MFKTTIYIKIPYNINMLLMHNPVQKMVYDRLLHKGIFTFNGTIPVVIQSEKEISPNIEKQMEKLYTTEYKNNPTMNGTNGIPNEVIDYLVLALDI